MGGENDSPLASISASSTYLKRIQTINVASFGPWRLKFSMKFARTCYWPKRSSLCSIFQSFIANLMQCQIGLWIKLGHGNKSACSELNPVQSHWAADLNQWPVQEKGVCSDSNQTADGSVQKLGNNLLHDYELSTTKVFSQISSKWNLNWKSKLVQTCIVWTSFDFQFEDFLSNLLKNNCLLWYWPTWTIHI